MDKKIETKVVGTKVVTAEVILNFPMLFKPMNMMRIVDGENAKYSVTLLIDKTDISTIEAIKQAIEQAELKGEGILNGSKKVKNTLGDGDKEKDNDAYRGRMFLKTSAKKKPQVINKKGVSIIDETEIYSGVYAHASLNFYAYNVSGTKGIACGLNSILKSRDGEPIVSYNAVDDFADMLELDENDFLN